MRSFFLLSSFLLVAQSYACDDCWEWPEDDGAFADEILNATNFYRAQHNASPLVWNDDLGEGAEGYVYGCKNVPYHGPYGELKNVGYNSPTKTVAAWMEERESYDFDAGVSIPGTANFTQLIWKSSTEMGCRRNVCDAEGYGLWGWYVICHYSPKGNVEGEYAANVQAAMGEVESPTSSMESSASTVESATSPMETPTSFAGNLPTGSPVANTTRGPVSNATASSPIGSATSSLPVFDNVGASTPIGGHMAAFWTSVFVGGLAVWVV